MFLPNNEWIFDIITYQLYLYWEQTVDIESKVYFVIPSNTFSIACFGVKVATPACHKVLLSMRCFSAHFLSF